MLSSRSSTPAGAGAAAAGAATGAGAGAAAGRPAGVGREAAGRAALRAGASGETTPERTTAGRLSPGEGTVHGATSAPPSTPAPSTATAAGVTVRPAEAAQPVQPGQAVGPGREQGDPAGGQRAAADGELAAQRLAGPAEQRADRRLGHAEALADGVVAEPLDLAGPQHGGLAGGHGVERVERGAGLVAGDDDVGGVAGGAHALGDLGDGGGAAADAQPVDDQTARDDGGPGGEVVLGAQLVGVLVGAQQGLLHQLLGLVPVTEAAQDVALQPRGDGADGGVEVGVDGGLGGDQAQARPGGGGRGGQLVEHGVTHGVEQGDRQVVQRGHLAPLRPVGWVPAPTSTSGRPDPRGLCGRSSVEHVPRAHRPRTVRRRHPDSCPPRASDPGAPGAQDRGRRAPILPATAAQDTQEPPVEHIVFFPAQDGAPAFRRVADLDDAVRLVEHLRNVEQVADVSVHALTEVPLAFRAYYKVEVAGVLEGPLEGSVEPAVEDVLEPAYEDLPVDVPLDLPVDDADLPPLVTVAQQGRGSRAEARGLGFFAS